MELDGFKNLAFNYRYIRWGCVGKYNTTTRWIKFKNKIQEGGLSGRPLFEKTYSWLNMPINKHKVT